MKKKITFSITFFLLLAFIYIDINAQETSKTAARKDSLPKPRTDELPQIQMQEYTIVGLAKVTLPRKIRKKIQRDVEIAWIPNRQIYKKEPPAISFQFSRIKPSLLQLYEFPWLNTRLHYGSFNTGGINLNTQFKANNTLPYLNADYQQSDGHLINAQWAVAGLQAGLHQKLSDNHLLHFATDYLFQKRGIWGDYEIYQQDWETSTVLWKFFGSLEDKWHPNFRTELTASYYLDDHENAFKYRDRGYDLTGSARLRVKNTEIESILDYCAIDLSLSDGNLVRLPMDSIDLDNFSATILSGYLYAQQKIGLVNIKAGVLYQQSEEDISPVMGNKIKDDFIYPDLSLLLGFTGQGKIFVRYRPAIETFRFRNSIQIIPFTDLTAIRLVNYTSRMEGGLDINPTSKFDLNLTVRSSRAENYPAVIYPADSLKAEFNSGGYPGWIMGTLNEVQIQELYGKIDWEIVRGLRFQGWGNYRNSDIRNSSNLEADVIGKEIPYFPRIESSGELIWNFYNKHKASVCLKYTDKRYDDLSNNTELPAYSLLNARLDLQIKRNINFFIVGDNLLDEQYEVFKGFMAPGISGFFGIQFKL
jgi:hypothetical protein